MKEGNNMIKNEKLLQEFRKMRDFGFMNLDADAFEKMLIDNVREEAAKANGTKNKYTLVKKVLKESEKKYNKNGLNPTHAMLFDNPATIKDGTVLHCFTDGTYILASENNFDVPTAESPYKTMSQFFVDIPRKVWIPLDIADIKAFSKMQTAKEFVPYVIKYNDILIGLDAKKLLDCLNFTETTGIFLEPQKSKYGISHINPVYMVNENSKEYALLLPVNMKEEKNVNFVAA